MSDRRTKLTVDYTRCMIGAEKLARIRSMTLSLDMDRVPFMTATVVCEAPSAALQAAADPRRSDGSNKLDLLFSHAITVDGVTRTLTFPTDMNGAAYTYGWVGLWVQESEYDFVEDTLTITAGGGEQLLMDKMRVAGTTLDTGAATVAGLVAYSLNDVFGTGLTTVVDDGPGATTIPAGDRRLMQPGDTHWSMLETELSAAGARLFADVASGAAPGYRLAFKIAAREKPITVFGNTVYASTLDNRKIPVTSARRTLSRSDWADGVLVRFDYLNGAGANTTAYQASGAGVNTKGVRLDRKRTPPAGNMANQIVTRTKQRGSSFEVVAGLDMAALPGNTLMLDTKTGTQNLGTIRAVEYDFGADTMTMRTQIGAPV